MRMKVVLLLIVTALGLVFANDLAKLSAKHTQFAADVYNLIGQDPTQKSFLVSPISLQIVLSMILAGARGDTGNEILRALHLPLSEKERLARQTNLLIKSFEQVRQSTLRTANKLYVNHEFTINDNYQKVLQNLYQSDVENANFKLNFETAKLINDWVKSQTENKINELINPASLSESTNMVLVNALYFKGEWAKKFEASTKSPFHLSAVRNVEVDMMRLQHVARYAENPTLDAKFLQLPYLNEEIVMTVVLPNKLDGLRTLELNTLAALQPQNYEVTKVDVKLPHFTTESSIEFVPILKELGVRKAFGVEADFKTIGSKKKGPVHISNIAQKTYINVTAAGTEAAAATYSGYITLSLPLPEEEPKQEFNVNHPFMYYLQHKSSGMILFVGRVADEGQFL